MSNEKSNTEDGNGLNKERAKVSERKRTANQANAQKSTGPRSARGKSHSCLNSLKHGLLARKVMFDASGKVLDAELLQLYEALCEEYGTDDVQVLLLLNLLIMDYWRMKQAFELEVHCRPTDIGFIARTWIPQAQRYATANRNSFHKSLELLAKIKQADDEAEADAEMLEASPESDGLVAGSQSEESECAEANPAELVPAIAVPQPATEEDAAAGCASESPTPCPGQGGNSPDDFEAAPEVANHELEVTA